MQHAQIEIPTNEFRFALWLLRRRDRALCLCAPGPGGRDSWCAYTGTFQDPAHACPAPQGKTCACPSLSVIGKALGWELGWAAHKKAYTRLSECSNGRLGA